MGIIKNASMRMRHQWSSSRGPMVQTVYGRLSVVKQTNDFGSGVNEDFRGFFPAAGKAAIFFKGLSL